MGKHKKTQQTGINDTVYEDEKISLEKITVTKQSFERQI